MVVNISIERSGMETGISFFKVDTHSRHSCGTELSQGCEAGRIHGQGDTQIYSELVL